MKQANLYYLLAGLSGIALSGSVLADRHVSGKPEVHHGKSEVHTPGKPDTDHGKSEVHNGKPEVHDSGKPDTDHGKPEVHTRDDNK
jgi:hypothetical protein